MMMTVRATSNRITETHRRLHHSWLSRESVALVMITLRKIAKKTEGKKVHQKYTFHTFYYARRVLKT